MSNARSPREVCSTTIGTSGLMVLASFRFLGRIPAECSNRPSSRPARSARTGSRAVFYGVCGPRLPGVQSCPVPCSARLLAGRPELLARLGLLDADRLGLARRAARPPGGWRRPRAAPRGRPLASAAARAARRRSAPSRSAAGSSASSSSSSVGSICSASTIAASTASRRSALRGVGLGLVGERLLVLAGDLQVGLLGDALARERRERLLEQLVGARVDEPVGHARSAASSAAASSTACSNSRSIACSSASRSRVGDVLAQLGERVEAGGLGRRTRRRARAGAWP